MRGCAKRFWIASRIGPTSWKPGPNRIASAGRPRSRRKEPRQAGCGNAGPWKAWKTKGTNMLDSSDFQPHNGFMASEPKTLQEAIVYFSNPDNCVSYLVAHRTEWKDGVICPTCGSRDVGYLASRRLWQCNNRHPKAQFSVKVGTIMEDSALGLDKWLTAIWMQTSMKNGVSSWEIHRAL